MSDPFAWISDHCHVSSSQDAMLNTAPYLLPNLAPSEDDDEEQTVVVMMSLPETPAEDEFRTPPERHSHPLTSSNEEVDCQDMEEEKTVDLSRDSEVVFGCESVDRDVNMLENDEEGIGAVAEVERHIGEDNEDHNGRDEGAVKVVDHQLMDGSTGGRKADDGATEEEQGICRVRSEERDGAETSRAVAHSSAGDGSGNKPSKTNEEPSQEELTENILKVLRLLARPRKQVYTEKVDILGSAMKAGITFPRPSWWPEDSDDDSI